MNSQRHLPKTLVALILINTLISIPRLAHAKSKPTPEQMTELHAVMDEEEKAIQPLRVREKELLNIRNALVQAKIKAIPGKITKAKASAVLKDPEVIAANNDIHTLRKTMIEQRKSYEDRKKAIFANH